MGRGFRLKGLAVNVGRGEDQTAALNQIRPRHFRVRSTTLQTEKAKVGLEGRVCLAMTSSLILPEMHPSQDLHTPYTLRALSLSSLSSLSTSPPSTQPYPRTPESTVSALYGISAASSSKNQDGVVWPMGAWGHEGCVCFEENSKWR